LRLVAAAVSCLLAFFLGVGLALWAERPAPPHYRLVRGSEDTVWRLNEGTGQVSVCGTVLAGHALSEMGARLSDHIRAAGHDPRKLQALLPEIDELDALTRPRCSPWSISEARAELEISGAQ